MKGKVLPILSRYGANWVDIFRSLLRGECWPDSGMDILVEFGPECSLLDIARINRELEEALADGWNMWSSNRQSEIESLPRISRFSEPRLSLYDISSAITSIAEYTRGMDEADFSRNRMAQDAIPRCLGIIGEVIRQLP